MTNRRTNSAVSPYALCYPNQTSRVKASPPRIWIASGVVAGLWPPFTAITLGSYICPSKGDALWIMRYETANPEFRGVTNVP